MQVKKLTELDVRGKKVFIRADLNVPQDDAGNITEDTRIRASLPSIQYCLDNGAAVMVTSHLGRPTEGTVGPDDTLAPVAVRLGQLLHRPVRLVSDWVEGGFERRWPRSATSMSMTPSAPPTAPRPPPMASPASPRWPAPAS